MLKYAVLLTALVGAIALGWTLDVGSRHGPGVSAGPAAPPTSLDRLAVWAPGRVEGLTKEIDLRPQLAERIVSIDVREGEFVAAGALLLRLDGASQQAAAAEARAELQAAQAELERLVNGAREEERRVAVAALEDVRAQLDAALRRLERTRKISQEGVVTREALDDQVSEVRSLQARRNEAQARHDLVQAAARPDEVKKRQALVAVAQARLQFAEDQLRKTELRSPCGGQVLHILPQVGEMAGPQSAEPAVTFVDPRRLLIHAFVDEFEAPRVRAGQLATVRADGLPGRTFAGRVVRLAPHMTRKQLVTNDPAERYDTKVREIWVELENGDGLVLGLRVDVELAGEGGR